MLPDAPCNVSITDSATGRGRDADETYIGRKTGVKKKHAGYGHKQAIFSLVELGGKVRSMHISGNMFEGVK